MKITCLIVPMIAIVSIVGCTQVPLINLHAPLKENGAYLTAAPEERPAAAGTDDDSLFQLTYWQGSKEKDMKMFFVTGEDTGKFEDISSKYQFSATAANKRQLTVKCIDPQPAGRYRLKISSVDDRNVENLIIDQEMHARSEIDFNPQPGKKYYITMYSIVNSNFQFMKRYTVSIPHLRGSFYSGPTLYPVGRDYGKYALGWGMGVAISPYATGTYDNYLFCPSVIIFSNVFMVDSTSSAGNNQNAFNFENIGLGVSWLYGISGGVIIDLHKFKSPRLFFGVNFIEVAGYFL